MGHAGSKHWLHALTDGDQFTTDGSRVLITDDRLWPMAKGCLNGPETRECYFEPLTKCTISDVQDVNSTLLSKNGDAYDLATHVVYLSPNDIWFRNIKEIYMDGAFGQSTFQHCDSRSCPCILLST